MRRCSNCSADVPENKGGINGLGEYVCCAHCCFNPLGCRCKYGEYEVAETYVDPDKDSLDIQVGVEFGIWGQTDSGYDI